ncbi:Adenylate isopentenyltransferase 5 [Hibiscus syriacus]|uniref:adenylate dimethylallyltransferase (ADP/ATP-dependent) n=1 Tax=Hibiscus syriacus TaxID=106335 RepID=A0A6A3A4B3_HIBSY|nr:adenylate isopentenyltransferase 5, chloroplastic-like [Hibiscus syriacus]KAE8698082.1 Adenylate isopentenyltransferase 5 [Hibiscus syriacus]
MTTCNGSSTGNQKMNRRKANMKFKTMNNGHSTGNQKMNKRKRRMAVNTISNGRSTENKKTNKRKVIFVMGATATGKSKLAIDLAIHFNGEIINSDKIQLYKGLEIITNKVTDEEAKGIRHHLLGTLDDPDQDFSAADFRLRATEAIEDILNDGKVPIIAGGSNSYIENLVEDENGDFRRRFDCCFIWVDVSPIVLHNRARERVDQMVAAGLVDEVRGMFRDGGGDYTRGIRRAIGVPEMEAYFTVEDDENVKEATKGKILANCIDEIKENTLKLIDSQLGKIRRLKIELGWKLKRVDATVVHEKSGQDAEIAWEHGVLKESLDIVKCYLK